MKALRLRERPGFRTFPLRVVYHILYFFFHCRLSIPPEIAKSDEPFVFVANHYSVFGPVSFVLSVPFPCGIWQNEEIINPETAARTIQPGLHSLLPFLSEGLIRRLSIWLGNLSCKILVRFGSIPVNRNEPSRLMSTMRRSVEVLSEGQNLLIFPETGLPEYSLTSVTPFFPGFATIGKLYHRRTGKVLRFCPCYIDEQHHIIRFGEPVAYNPENPDIKEESSRVSEELNLRIRRMAAASYGVRREKSTPVRRTILFFCNLLRLLLLVPLLVMVGIPNPRVAMILYAISQGLRILFNAVVSSSYSASNRLSSLLSHTIGMLTDIVLLSYLTTLNPGLRWLLLAIALNGIIILIGNLVSLAKTHRCAGVNYFDTLSGNLICVICLQQLFRIRLNRVIFGVLMLAACVFLILSAAFSIAFNIRIHQGLEEFEQAISNENMNGSASPISLPDGAQSPEEPSPG